METSFLKKQKKESFVLHHEYQLTKYDYGLTLFGVTSFTCGMFITRNARREMKKLGNRYNVSYQHRPNKLVARGIYRFSRHPIYLGVMLMVIGGPLCFHTTLVPLYKRKGPKFLNYIYAFWSLNALAAFTFFDRIEIPREEKVLRDTFGTKYTQYKDITP
eukprot:378609_1